MDLKKQKQAYEAAEIEVVDVDTADIICTSNGFSTQSLDDGGDLFD